MNEFEGYRVLIIDDNPAIHDDIRKVLGHETKKTTAASQAKKKLLGVMSEPQIELMPYFEIDSAYQGQEGLEKIKKALANNSPYALSFIDIRMPPGWDGVETINHIWEVDKEVQIVICTAHSDYSWPEMVRHIGTTDRLLILKKPFDSTEIRQLACSLTKKWAMARQIKEYLNSLESEVSLRTAQIMATLESTTDGILSVESHQKILNFNQKFMDIWEIPKNFLNEISSDELIKFIAEKLHNSSYFIARIKELNENVEASSFDVLHTKEGKIIECYSQPQKIDNKYKGRVWSFRDVTKSKELEDKLAYQATHDALTDLPNRALLYDRLRLAIANAERSSTNFAVLFFDLDGFKFINDTLGHTIGDDFLKEVSKRLLSCIRDSDTLARIGGDEFVMIISYLKKEEDVIRIVQKCLAVLEEAFNYGENKFYLTASVGISLFPKDGSEGQALLRNADMAMYRAKEMKPLGFRFYTNDLNARADERLILENNLRKALENNQFELYYQPQISLIDGSLIGAEALLRWRHPKLGLIPPIKFIPIAEEIGLIVPIGEWVFREACTQYKIWEEEGFSFINLGVNLSAQQLKQNSFVQIIKNILHETKMDPKRLEFEFTESCLMSDTEIIISKIIALKKLGVSLAIDDFGTGYSSLSYLKLLPIDRIKIDQSFIHYISNDPADTSIILAILAIAESLKLKVLAEGVETYEQLNFLKANHCNEAQGYYFSRPLNTKKFTTLLKNNRNWDLPTKGTF